MARLLAIDHGTVRIGLAMSDELELVASPLRTVDGQQKQPENEIADIIRSKRIAKIIIGMPYHMSGEKGSAAARVEAFAKKLSQVLDASVPIEFIDERLSSVEAEAALSRSGLTGKRERDAVVDQLAAVVILQDYLNQQRGPEGYLLPEECYNLPLETGRPASKRRR
jgi:putative holliday junction resolvase